MFFYIDNVNHSKTPFTIERQYIFITLLGGMFYLISFGAFKVFLLGETIKPFLLLSYANSKQSIPLNPGNFNTY